MHAPEKLAGRTFRSSRTHSQRRRGREAYHRQSQSRANRRPRRDKTGGTFPSSEPWGLDPKREGRRSDDSVGVKFRRDLSSVAPLTASEPTPSRQDPQCTSARPRSVHERGPRSPEQAAIRSTPEAVALAGGRWAAEVRVARPVAAPPPASSDKPAQLAFWRWLPMCAPEPASRTCSRAPSPEGSCRRWATR